MTNKAPIFDMKADSRPARLTSVDAGGKSVDNSVTLPDLMQSPRIFDVSGGGSAQRRTSNKHTSQNNSAMGTPSRFATAQLKSLFDARRASDGAVIGSTERVTK